MRLADSRQENLEMNLVSDMLKPTMAVLLSSVTLIASSATLDPWLGEWRAIGSKDKVSITATTLSTETVADGKTYRHAYRFVGGSKAPIRNGQFFMKSPSPQDKRSLLTSFRENLASQKANGFLDAAAAREKKIVEATLNSFPEGRLDTIDAFVNDDQGSGDCASTSFVLIGESMYHLEECESDGSGLHITTFAKR
jgi:hypothetical protein